MLHRSYFDMHVVLIVSRFHHVYYNSITVKSYNCIIADEHICHFPTIAVPCHMGL